MKVLNRTTNRKIGQAMHRYAMLADADRVLVAVSGGVDSLVLSWILRHWQHKAPIRYEIQAVFIDNGFDGSMSARVVEQLDRIGLPCRVEKTDFWHRAAAAEDGKSTCYHCARLRRNRLFDLAAAEGFNKISFGHHKDDILETFLLNLLYGGNISTMVPRQELFSGRLHIIRPMAYLEKGDILEIAAAAAIEPVKNPCPRDRDSKRQKARMTLDKLSRLDGKVKSNIFAALANIRPDYLL